MKKTFLMLALIMSFPANAADSKCAQNQTVAIVDGMVCDFCAQGLIKTFKKNKNVDDVKIDLTSKKVTVDMKPGTVLDDAEVAKNVEWGGYKLVKIDHVCKKLDHFTPKTIEIISAGFRL